MNVRTDAGNRSHQAVLGACLGARAPLHDALDAGQARQPSVQRTVVRDAGLWSPQLDLGGAGYGSLVSLPLGHGAAQQALQMAAQRRAIKSLTGKLSEVRAARARIKVGALDRTLVVIESQELLAGQKRGISVALRKAQEELATLERLIEAGRISLEQLKGRLGKAAAREPVSSFVVASVGGSDKAPTLQWHVDAAPRRELETTRLGRRVLCTDRHDWSTRRIVYASRGQSNVEDVFRRAKKGGIVPWGRSHQWADGSLRLRTLCDRPGADACEPGKDGPGQRVVRPSHDAGAGGRQRDAGTHRHRQHGPTTHGDAGARAIQAAAQRRQGLRVGAVVPISSFMCPSPCR
jgi:hypothetical protein